jgi:hypothetical protein
MTCQSVQGTNLTVSGLQCDGLGSFRICGPENRPPLSKIDQHLGQPDISQQRVWNSANLVMVDQALEEMNERGHGNSLPVCGE